MRHRLILALSIMLAILAALPAVAARYPMTVKDSRGKSITVRSLPKRIVSLAPSNTEILFALGLDSRIVGDSKWCDYPEAAKKKPKIGDQVTSIEKVVALRPDLVVAHGKINDEAIRAIEKHGITVVALDPRTIGELLRDIRQLGMLTGTEAAARKVTGRIETVTASVRARLARVKTRPRVLVAVQADPLWVAGPKTFVDEILGIAHASNLASKAKPGFHQYSTEIAVASNPDIIIGTYAGDRRVFTSGQWKSTKAAKTGRIYTIRPEIIVRAGPRLADGLMAVARMVHPDAFRAK